MKLVRRGRLLVLPFVSALACSSGEPRPLAVGEDVCDYCRMQISDARFGGELITKKGKIHTFDSIECLTSYYLAMPDTTDAKAILVSDFNTAMLIPAAEARFTVGTPGSTPMGQGWIATRAPASSDSLSAVGWAAVIDASRRAREARPRSGAESAASTPVAR